MTIKEFQKQIINALASQKAILKIVESENSLLINCNDESNFLLNILESKLTFIHNDRETEEIEKYISTHSQNEYEEDLLNTARKHPAFFIYFMLFTKLEEKSVIDRCLFYHIIDSIVYYEQEFEEFMTRILNHCGIDEDNPHYYKDTEHPSKDDDI